MSETPQFVVRAARRDDAEAVSRVFAHYVRETAITFETVVRTPEEWRRLWAELAEQGWPCLVGELEGEVVGFAYAAPWRTKPAYRHTVETTVYLAPGLGRRGYGRALTSRVLEGASANGAREVIAVIADTGDPASRMLHAKLGFTDVGTLQRVGYKFDRWIDVRLMQKSLDRSSA